jgi:hypothetical protein
MRSRNSLVLVMAVGISMAACGPSPLDEDVPDVEGRIAGTAVKGPLAHATVVIYAGEDGAWRQVAGADNTDEAGGFDVSVGLRRGDLLVSVSGGTYVESSTGRRVGLGGRRLEAWALDVDVGEKRDGVQVNPVTTWIAALTRWRMAELGERLEHAELQAASVLNGHLGGIDWRTILPRNLTATRDVPFDDRAIAGLVLASISELVSEKAEAQGQGAEVNSGALVSLVAEDLEADGALDGLGINDQKLSMHGADLEIDSLRVGLARAMYRFVYSDRNGSGLTFEDVRSLIESIANSNAAVFPAVPDLSPVIGFASPAPGAEYFGEVTVHASARAAVTEIVEATLTVGGDVVAATVTPDGPHGVVIEATVDLTDVVGPLEIGLEVETRFARRGTAAIEVIATEAPVGPVVVGLMGPADPTRETTATLAFGCSKDDCAFTCRLDGAAHGEVAGTEACVSGVTYDDLDDDAYTFTVVATDDDGATSPPATWAWTVDTFVPVVEIFEGPPAETIDTTATFTFGCVNTDGCVYECAFDPADPTDEGAWAPCTSPMTYEYLEPGQRAFHVRVAGDLGAESDPAVLAWTVVYGWGEVATGGDFTCGLTTDGRAWCWGHNGVGELGDGTEESRPFPTPVASDARWTRIAPGMSHTCGIQRDGSLWCWGYNHMGQLGTGDQEPSSLPVQVGDADDWIDVDGQEMYTCGIRDGGTLWCWGHHGFDPEGSVSPDDLVLYPTRVGSFSGWRTLSAGYSHSCVLRSDGSLYCWGFNGDGQLGLPTVESTATPLIVEPGSSWLHVSAGGMHTCAIRSDRTLWCWGRNDWQQVSEDPSPTVPEPVQVGEHADWVSVSAAGVSTCAFRDDAAWCWGNNWSGQLGREPDDGTAEHELLLSRSDMRGLSTKAAHGCVHHDDGTAQCWGSNYSGQLGAGLTVEWSAPVALPIP